MAKYSVSILFFVENRRCRKVEHNKSPYQLIPATINTYADSIEADLVNKNNGVLFMLKVEGVEGDVFHVTIDEKNQLKKRYRAIDALKQPIKTHP